jgi:hypothetical protein
MNTLLWSFGGMSALLPAPIAYAVPLLVMRAGEVAQDHLIGVEPQRLSRPPSTPSIA